MRLKTAADILDIFTALKHDDVASYFDKDDDEIDPYVVCDGVSVDAFNEYIGDGEGLRIGLRFMCLSDDGRIMIVDLPTVVHECTARSFDMVFDHAVGDPWAVASAGSMTVSRDALPNKEADATFGPKRSTPNRTPTPAPRTGSDWVTLAVEVGRCQSWASLIEAVRWWCGYVGIEYVLVLKISANGRQMKYALYDSRTRPSPTTRPAASGTFRHRTAGAAVNVTFDMHRILSIPADQALPNGVNPVAVVNLRAVMDAVIDSIG